MENTIYLRDGWVRISTYGDSAKFSNDELQEIKYMLEMYEDDFRVVDHEGYTLTYANQNNIENYLYNSDECNCYYECNCEDYE